MNKWYYIFYSVLVAGTINALPYRVIIFRHGEKESICGNLSPRGVERSIALANFFKTCPPILAGQKPKAFFACEGRTIQTITPTAESFPETSCINVNPVKTYFALPDVNRERFVVATHEVVQEILNNKSYCNKVLLVCWEHRNIPLLAKLLGAIQAPNEWPDESFDMFWIITYTCGAVQFEILPENLLPGDETRILPEPLGVAIDQKYCLLK